jgi:hypothetical protein
MAGDVRRSGGQWHAADSAPAGGFAPPGPATCHRWHARVLVGAAQWPAVTLAPRCACPKRVRRVRRWPTWPRATSRPGRVPALSVQMYFMILFSKWFFSNFPNETVP